MISIRLRLKRSWFVVLLLVWMGLVTAIFVDAHTATQCEAKGGRYAHFNNEHDECLLTEEK